MKASHYFKDMPERTGKGIICPDGNIVEINPLDAHSIVLSNIIPDEERTKHTNFKNVFELERHLKFFRFSILDGYLYVLSSRNDLKDMQYKKLVEYANSRNCEIRFDVLYKCRSRSSQYNLKDF